MSLNSFVLVLSVIFLLASECSGQGPDNSTTDSTSSSTTSTTIATPLDTPTSTQTPTEPTIPTIPPTVNPTDIEANLINYQLYGSICCNVQTACQGCDNIYDVNGIVYCCPGCNGISIVTDLICRCYPPNGFDINSVNCSISNTIVGGYVAWRPSYYTAGASSHFAIWLSVFTGITVTLVVKFL